MMSKYSTKILLVVSVLGIWAASLFLTYDHTREKWYGLGTSSGKIQSKAEVLVDLCEFAINGNAKEPVVWNLIVKAGIVELTGENGAFTLYCR